MDDLKFLRQQDVVPLQRLQSTGITLIGLGSVGSFVGLALAKMGALLTAYDPDIVEAHNWSNQAYGDDDIGTPKASAFIRLIEGYGGHTPNSNCQKYADQELSELVISAVDSMDSRKLIWRAVHKSPEVQVYVDCRMSLQVLDIHVVRNFVKSDRIRYNETLYSDEEALQEPCTARSIAYAPFACAGIVASIVKRHTCDEELPGRVVLDLATLTLMAD